MVGVLPNTSARFLKLPRRRLGSAPLMYLARQQQQQQQQQWNSGCEEM
jgi:hypothetical protein